MSSDLVARLRRRHPGAFDELYRQNRERIWGFLFRLSGRAPFAEDLFQDTWLAVARNAHRLREDTELVPWLYTIARNKHRNALRALAFDRRRQTSVMAEPARDPPTPDTETDARRRAHQVGVAFASLADAHREVLLLAAAEGLETAEIAAILGLREDAVRKRLSRARAELVRLTGPRGGEEP